MALRRVRTQGVRRMRGGDMVEWEATENEEDRFACHLVALCGHYHYDLKGQ